MVTKRCEFLLRVGHVKPYRVGADCGAADEPHKCPRKRSKCQVNQSCWQVRDKK